MIGFYVHHQGRGHLARVQALLPPLRGPATVLTSVEVEGVDLGDAHVVTLPLDTDPVPSRQPRMTSLHYAPVGSRGLTERTARIAEWARACSPALLVVDVSVEVTMLGRLLGLPVVVVRQHGDRRDEPHRIAYDVAASLLAPYPAALEEPTTPDWVRARTCYTGFFSRFDDRTLDRDEARQALGIAADDRHVVVLGGAGGVGADRAAMGGAVAEASASTPGWTWTILGAPPTKEGAASDVRWTGWTHDPFPHLRAADVVVSAAGHNAVCETLAADRPLVCVPEERPFGEQRSKADALAAAGVAVVCDRWPGADAWPDVLAHALELDPAERGVLLDRRGAPRGARHLLEVAERYRR